MRCDAAAAIGLAVVAATGVAAAGPNQLAVDGAQGVGVAHPSLSTVTASYARRLWHDRLYAEARLGAGFTSARQPDSDLGVYDARVGAGLVVHRGSRLELRVGWRLGDTYLYGELEGDAFDVHTVAIQLAPTAVIRFAAAWAVRITPVAPTLYWNQTYGGTVGLELGVEYAL